MGNWYEGIRQTGKYLSVRTGGEPVRLTVREIVKTEEGDPKFQFKTKDGRCLGYSYIIHTEEDQEFNVNTFALLGKLADMKINCGDMIEIAHPATGKWEVKRV